VIRFIVRVLVLLATEAWALPPPARETGVVYDAATHLPLPGVIVTAHVEGINNPEFTEFNSAPHVVVVRTDSLGRYSVGYHNAADVVYVAAGYDTLRLRWPDDLENSEPCTGLVDVHLTRTRKGENR
jgi:hypothetical protein